jgi:hypothetical protein
MTHLRRHGAAACRSIHIAPQPGIRFIQREGFFGAGQRLLAQAEAVRRDGAIVAKRRTPAFVLHQIAPAGPEDGETPFRHRVGHGPVFLPIASAAMAR